jgi:hypothetical protein
MKRWDKVLYDTRSAQATHFKGLLHKALYVVEAAEFNRVKAFLTYKLRRNPSTAEILKEAKATIPDPDTLNKRMDAVMKYVFYKDIDADDSEPLDANGVKKPSATRYFKVLSDEVRSAINNQLKHITKGCISDPQKEVINMHRVNPTNQKAYTTRSTGTNENDNMQLYRLLNSPTVGIHRAERVISDHYEQSNDRKKVSRLGEHQLCTHRTEKLYVLNSIAVELGFKEDQLPVKEAVSIPTSIDSVTEYIGWLHKAPTIFEAVGTGEEEEETNDNVAVEDLANFMAGVNFDNDDVAVPTDDLPQLANMMDVNPIPLTTPVDTAIPIVIANVVTYETTFDAFKRLTEERPWVPFSDPKSSDPPTDPVDKAEYELFERLLQEDHYNRHISYLYAAKGFGSFSKKWDIEVADRFKRKTEGEDVVLIRRKSALFLQQFYDPLNKYKDLQCLVNK